MKLTSAGGAAKTFLGVLALTLGIFSSQLAYSQVQHETLTDGTKAELSGLKVSTIRFQTSRSIRRPLVATTALQAQMVAAALPEVVKPLHNRLGIDSRSTFQARTLRYEKSGRSHITMDHLIARPNGELVPVFGDRITAHLNSSGSIEQLTINLSSVSSIASFSQVLSEAAARTIASDILRARALGAAIRIDGARLVYVDVAQYTLNDDAPKVYLAWQVDAAALNANQREIDSLRIFLDATQQAPTQAVLSIPRHTSDRRIYDCSIADTNNGNCYSNYVTRDGERLGRTETSPPAGVNFRFGFADVDNVFSGINSAQQYLISRFERNGANEQGGIAPGNNYPVTDVEAFTFIDTVSNSCPNAYYNGQDLNFCAGFGGALDVIAHEYSHALTEFSAQLVYQGEQGALNESFSDIFGNAVDHWQTGYAGWVIGRHLPEGLLGGALRDMADPTNYNYQPNTPYPDRFMSPNFYCGAEDNGGVHINSSVLNKGAHLIAVGGSFNNCSIVGIGRTAMENIAYRALTVYLQPNSNFNQAYLGLVNAASDLYGPSSQEVVTVKKALMAVEMHQPGRCSSQPPSTLTCNSVPGPGSATPTPTPPSPTPQPTATPVPPPPTVSLVGYEIKLRRQSVSLSLSLVNVAELRAVEALLVTPGSFQKRTVALKPVSNYSGRVQFTARIKVALSQKQKRRRFDVYLRTRGEVSGLQLVKLGSVTVRR